MAYQPPSEDVYDVMFDGEADPPSPEEVQLKELHAQWVDLHAATKKNLLEFERPNFRLPTRARGHADVKKLVSQQTRYCVSSSAEFRPSSLNSTMWYDSATSSS
jgi:hypothetical protein